MAELLKTVRLSLPNEAQELATDVVVEDTGDGEWTLLCLHGFGDNLHTWQSLRTILEPRGARVVALDLPGFGRSPMPAAFGPEYSLRAVDVVHAFARELARERDDALLLAGNSLGGAIGLGAMIRDRRATRRCIDGAALLSPATPATRTPMFVRLLRAPVYRWSEDLMARLPTRARRAAAGMITRTVIQMMVHPGFRPSRAWRESIIDAFVRPGSWRDLETVALDLLWTLRGKRRGVLELLEHTDQVSTPVHVVRGELDRVISRSELVHLAAELPHGAYSELPGIGHCPQNEAPARCAEIVLDLLDAVRGLDASDEPGAER
ncbi:MAG: alpha/beta hydrolase [Planctomycetota bacterium]